MKKLLGNKPAETLDTLFEGQLKIRQREKGYRFSIDALLLAHFADPRPKDQILDLGTGCGVIPLILIFRRKAEAVVGVEIQPALAELARKNVSLNHYSSQIEIWEKDMKALGTESMMGKFDFVLSNPPYRKFGSGRINPLEEKAVARHEIQATLEDILRTGHHLLKNKGRFCLIYPATRATDLFHGLRHFHLEPKRVQFVHSHPQDEASLMLVDALKEGKAQIQVLPPFVLYETGGQYTPQTEELFR
jgi:tRNA1Val (adenine37-N6)-methyltransferase